MTKQTAGQRLYLIRLAHGDGVRTAESLADFAERVKKATGEWYDPTTLSLLERNKQNWKLADAEVLSQVDPKKRGREWLAWGEEPPTQPAIVEPYYGEPVKPRGKPAKRGKSA